MKIIDSIWFSGAEKYSCIGIVTIETEVGERKSYIGVGEGINQKDDEQEIATWGAPFYYDVVYKRMKESRNE